MCETKTALRVAAAVAGCFSLIAAAQQRPEAGNVLEQQTKQPVPLPPREAPVVPEAAPPRPALPVSPTLKVAVKDFRFSGNTVFPADELRAVLLDFVGKTLDFEGLNDAAGRVQRYYRDHGYFLAVAYLPRQEITNGTVEITVLEGRIGQVNLQMPQNARLRESYARSILNAHLKPGDLITEEGLERPLLLIRDLPGVDLSSTLGPNKQQQGAADLTVKVQEDAKRYNGYFDFDNSGNRFTGEYHLGVNVNAEDFTGYGDLFSFRGFVSDAGMTFGRAAYVIPVGPYGTRAGISYTTFDYKLGKDFASLKAHGDGDVTTLYGLHPIRRTRNANFLVQAALELKHLNDFTDSTSTEEHRKISTGKLGAVGDFRDSAFSGGLNSYSFTYTEGHLTLSPTALAIADVAPGTGLRTAGSFGKLNVDYRRLQRVTDDFNVLLAFSGQAASKNLASAEKFSLGGPNGVRAYPVGEAPGDSGYLVTAELRYIVPKYALFGGDVTLSTFYDMGVTRGTQQAFPSVTNNERAIAGWGIGASLGREGRFMLKTSVAQRLENEAPVSDTARRIPRVWVQAIKWF